MSEAERHLDHYFSGAATNSEYARSWRAVKAKLGRLRRNNDELLEDLVKLREMIDRLREKNASLKLQLSSCRESYADYIREVGPR